MKLDNQIALVTGGDSGIGQAIATLFAEAGADLCITYHTDADGAAETRRRIEAAGRQALVAPLDVRDAAAVDALFARVARELGVPDVLVNNAGKGMGAQVPVADLPDDQVAVILDTNLKGPLHCASGASGAAEAASSRSPRWPSTCRRRTRRPTAWRRPASAR